MPTQNDAPDGRANLRIAAVAVGALTAALAQTLIIPVLPTLTDDLGTSAGGAQWLLTSTLLVAAISVPVMGRFADMFGRRLLLLVALGALAVGSLIDTFTSNYEVMLAGRVIAGFSAAAIPLGISLLSVTLPEARRGSATALVSAMLGIGGAVGLPLAGVIGDNADYHLLFAIGAIGAILSFVAVLTLVREPPFERQHHIDWPGIGLLTTGLATLVLAVSQGGTWGWGSPAVLGLLAVSIVAITVLTRVEDRVANPLIDMPAFKRPPIALTNIASLFIGFALFASFTGTATYVQAPESTGYGFGSTILTAGLCLLPSGLLMLALAPVAAKLIARVGPAYVLAAAGAILAVGLVYRIVAVDALWQVVVGASIIGAGTGIGYAALPSLIDRHTPREQLAAANGINTLARSLGSTLASAIGGALLTGLTMTVAGNALPSLDAYRVLFGICAAAAILASLIGLHLARRPGPREAAAVAA
ncbi:MFS transporter [Patulibacter minatonensis]|uniref:MFS transporter n=1 Tax=Patulibacter minatonensis TaxID=298163 RepID=UPI00056A0683|nr:MFS transporter [Patulibacter minatonensis]